MLCRLHLSILFPYTTLFRSFIFACLYAVQPLLPVFVNVFHISVSKSSLSLSLTIVGLIIGLNVLGLLSDRYGRTFLIKGALVGSFLLFLIIPLTVHYLQYRL